MNDEIKKTTQKPHTLIGLPEKEHDKQNNTYSSQIIEQYRIYTQRLDNDLDRAQQTNRFYLTINAAIVSGVFIVSKNQVMPSSLSVLIITIPAILFCIAWLFVLKSASKISTAQHEVVEDMEKLLPLRPYTLEWHEKLAEGTKHITIATIRMFVPWIFILTYLGAAIAMLLLE